MVVQVTLAVVLVASTGLMVRSFANAINADLGFAPDGSSYHVVVPVDARIARGLKAGNRPADGTPFDAALVDLGLPDAAGLEAVDALQGADPELAVVVLTGREDPRLAELAMRDGCTPTNPRPIDEAGFAALFAQGLA